MVTRPKPEGAPNRIVLAREALRQYGSIRGRLLPFAGGAPALSSHLRVNLIGQYSERRMTEILRAFFALSPPDRIYVCTQRRSDSRGSRPAVQLTWYGPAATRLFDQIGWEIGKPKLDAGLAAWKRWMAYRKASHGARYD